MADDEDDIVFDRAGLLDNQVKPTIRHKMPKTLLLFVAFLGIGMCIAIPGPTLTNLQQTANVTLNEISFIYSARALGYLAGSVSGGMLFDWLNQQMVIALAMLITAITTTVIPFSQSITLMSSFVALQGLSMGIVDTGGNALLIHTWGRKTGPYMQALHFFFGLGAFIAPLIAAPFLATNVPPVTNNFTNITNNITYDITNGSTFQNMSYNSTTLSSTMVVSTTVLNSISLSNAPTTTATKGKRDVRSANNAMVQWDLMQDLMSRRKRDAGEKTPVHSTTQTPPLTTTSQLVSPNVVQHLKGSLVTKLKNLDLDRSEFAYVTISALMLFISCLFWFSCCQDHCSIIAVRSHEAMEMLRKESRSFKIQILLLIFIFYFSYKGLEITFGQFIPTFVKTRFGWSEEKSAFVVALFWGMFALTRALSICFAKCIGPTKMLIIDLGICFIALLVMIIGLKNPFSNAELVIWSSSALFGMGLASILPTGFTWAERYMEVTGKTTSVFVVGSALGETIVPLITGFIMDREKTGAMSMVYVLSGCYFLCAIVFIFLQNMASRQGERPSVTSKPAASHAAALNDEHIEMEPVRGDSVGKKKVTFNMSENNGPRNKLKKLIAGQKAD